MRWSRTLDREVFSWKLDCCLANHCLQIAEQRSVETLAFNFASRSCAYRRLAKDLSRSVSSFSSSISEYLDPVFEADQCAQYVEDIVRAAKNAADPTPNIRAVFERICEAGWKLTIEKCHIGVTHVEFLGKTFLPQFQHNSKFSQQAKILANQKFTRTIFPEWTKNLKTKTSRPAA